MQRTKASKQTLQSLYTEFNESLDKKLPPLDTEDPESLKQLLEAMYLREGMASRQKAKYKHKKSSQLRSAIADLLLLYDGKDYKIKPTAGSAQQATETTSSKEGDNLEETADA